MLVQVNISIFNLKAGKNLKTTDSSKLHMNFSFNFPILIYL